MITDHDNNNKTLRCSINAYLTEAVREQSENSRRAFASNMVVRDEKEDSSSSWLVRLVRLVRLLQKVASKGCKKRGERLLCFVCVAFRTL